MPKPVILVGYGGHGFVAADIIALSGLHLAGYCDNEQKKLNPFDLAYLGKESTFFIDQNIKSFSAFIAVGNADIRKKLFQLISSLDVEIINAIHPRAVVAENSKPGKGVFIAANATINPFCTLGNGVICNTSSSVDHECTIGDFSHICPGTVLCGNVTVGKNSFIGANSTVIPGKTIGDRVIVGAGSTVINDLLVPGVYVGSPARLLKKAK